MLLFSSDEDPSPSFLGNNKCYLSPPEINVVDKISGNVLNKDIIMTISLGTTGLNQTFPGVDLEFKIMITFPGYSNTGMILEQHKPTYTTTIIGTWRL